MVKKVAKATKAMKTAIVVASKKAMKVKLKNILKRPISAVGSGDDDDDSDDADDDDDDASDSQSSAGATDNADDPSVKAKPPPSLQAWLESRKKGREPEWTGQHAKGVCDWIKALKTHNYTGVAKQLEQTKPKDRRDLIFKLYLCKKESEMKAFEVNESSKSEVHKGQCGWMNQFEVFALKKVPIIPDTERFRTQFLSKLEPKSAPDEPGGKVWYFEHIGHKEVELRNKRSIKVNAKAKIQEKDWESMNLGITTDFSKMHATLMDNADVARERRKSSSAAVEEIDDSDDDPLDPGEKPKAKAKAKSKGEKKKPVSLEDKINDMGLTGDHKNAALAGIQQTKWERESKSVIAGMSTEINDFQSVKDVINAHKKKMGKGIVSNYDASKKVLTALHQSFNSKKIKWAKQDPFFFTNRIAMSALADAQQCLKSYKTQKKNVLEIAKM